MGALVLPVLAAALVTIIIGAWIALVSYDRKHPPSQDEKAARGRDGRR